MSYNPSEIKSMLEMRGEDQKNLFEKARNIRDSIFDNTAIVRGVIEITNACAVNCDYCPMRKDNKIDRFYLKEDDILEACKQIYDSGIRVVFLQSGEVGGTTSTVSHLIPKIKTLFNNDVEVLLCLGSKSFYDYQLLRESGADSYILKHETANPILHQKVRHESFEDRLECIKNLLTLGYSVGTGTIINLPGQEIEDLIEDIILAHDLNTHMVSVSPFIPAPGTPFAQSPDADLNLTLNALAITRIMNPSALIPSVSALEKLSPGGQIKGFMAGANVITVNFSPEKNRSNYLIYGKERFIVKLNHALDVLKNSNLKPNLNLDRIKHA